MEGKETSVSAFGAKYYEVKELSCDETTELMVLWSVELESCMEGCPLR